MTYRITRYNRIGGGEAEHDAAPKSDQVRNAGWEISEMEKCRNAVRHENEEDSHNGEHDGIQQDQSAQQGKFHGVLVYNLNPLKRQPAKTTPIATAARPARMSTTLPSMRKAPPIASRTGLSACGAYRVRQEAHCIRPGRSGAG